VTEVAAAVMMAGVPVIRPYRPTDRAAVAEVCIRTGDAGGEARGKYPDPDLLPVIFALPYVELEPELALVLDDGGTAVGYVLGTADTARFVERFRREWLPAVAPRFPLPAGPAETPAEWLVGLLHHPERMLVPEVAGHPAHLHIDLLPDYQGSGFGRRLMTEFLTALGRAGVPSVHLGMATTNTRARAFYDRMGFEEIAVPGAEGTTYLARPTITP
jgi:ribosomal protein S18 acetylase RimI-like enzyme